MSQGLLAAKHMERQAFVEQQNRLDNSGYERNKKMQVKVESITGAEKANKRNLFHSQADEVSIVNVSCTFRLLAFIYKTGGFRVCY